MMRLPSTNQLSTNRLSTKLQHSVAAPLFFYSLQDGREGLFVSIGMGAQMQSWNQAQGMGIGAAEGRWRVFCEGLSGFFCGYKVF